MRQGQARLNHIIFATLYLVTKFYQKTSYKQSHKCREINQYARRHAFPFLTIPNIYTIRKNTEILYFVWQS